LQLAHFFTVLSGAIVAQIVHRPTIFDDEKRYPFSAVLRFQNPNPEDQGGGFYDPEYSVKDLFVPGYSFVVGDVSKKLPHRTILAGNGSAVVRRRIPAAALLKSATRLGARANTLPGAKKKGRQPRLTPFVT
jgi:hypothetical protein